ncbi:MAG: hypothetical protein K2N23_00490, partial [Clostridia bacterium]|nr:hypothetical protein [Clostridia bacterium]
YYRGLVQLLKGNVDNFIHLLPEFVEKRRVKRCFSLIVDKMWIIFLYKCIFIPFHTAYCGQLVAKLKD